VILERDRPDWVRLRESLWPGSLSDHDVETRRYFQDRPPSAGARDCRLAAQSLLPRSDEACQRNRLLPIWKVMAILSKLERELVMTNRVERPTPHEAAAALDSIEHMTGVALRRGLHSRWFAASVSLWGGATAVATAYDGPAASLMISALLAGGSLGLALWRRRIVARVRNVHGMVGAVSAAAVAAGVLVIGLAGARAFEVYGLPWAPFASGGMVASVLFMALEVLRRATRAKLASVDA